MDIRHVERTLLRGHETGRASRRRTADFENLGFDWLSLAFGTAEVSFSWLLAGRKSQGKPTKAKVAKARRRGRGERATSGTSRSAGSGRDSACSLLWRKGARDQKGSQVKRAPTDPRPFARAQ